MIKRDELKLDYQRHQFYEYFNSIFNYDILDASISENIYLLRKTTDKLFYIEFENQLFETVMFLSMKTLVLDMINCKNKCNIYSNSSSRASQAVL